MRPEYYSDLFRRYSTYCRNYDGHKLYKIASGASDYDYNWTKVLMDRVGNQMSGLSLHYYTVKTWNGAKGSATAFTADEYYQTLAKCLQIEDVINRHCALMDQKDPEKKIGLMVDEWGTWWDEEPGTVRGHLYQQNTMRDAMVAALTLNVFQRHTDRIRMANIAQVVNVLQSMILTDTIGEGHIVLTPTYHVFNLYRGFQNATHLPATVSSDSIFVAGGKMYRAEDGKVPTVSVSAARKQDGSLIISLANTSLNKAQDISIALEGATAKQLTARILTAKQATDYNDFANPNRVNVALWQGVKLKKGKIEGKLPPLSIAVIETK